MISSPYEAAFAAFVNTVYDMPGLSRLVDDLTLVERSLFKEKTGTISEKVKDYLTGRVLTIFQEIELAALEPQDDRKQLEFVRDLISFLNNLPQVRVTIAFDPTVSYVIKLNNVISQQAGKKVIFDIVIDDKIIGGAIFEYKGRICEQTLQSKLESKLSDLIDKAYEVGKVAAAG
ncbi:hypothetical protein A3A60_03945 [Candidatus Curtissbacteria bacterium RIFCSPLOWO2_01_FULL_42_26]|uniref:Uncharacterized protein n=1 Tax=Candidatus Curtissbacteria bacterium RIFCSPLOWO2_01_FULL_42_26 TaxID=1797729 RepID=A0A1F5HYY3_9BACT|nr:MAG: hypothetical protein A3A60_03945 [Candidatus Curtissbacteria bacterium RIFCSPLOWO2_01_FULL_42_26]